jgi:hypothetical protein
LRQRGLDFERSKEVFAGLTIDIPDLRRALRVTSGCRMAFIGLQTDYEPMERKRAIGEKLKATGPRAAQPKISHSKDAELRLRDRRIKRGRET